MTSSARLKPFSIEARLATLQKRHRELEDRIASERQRPAPCSVALQKLKRRKLGVKDEMVHFDGVLRTLDIQPDTQPRA
ncbi:hypothetical protein SAMN05421853_1113 [Roseivivax halotolerans]|uniref:DUF465 domain-containing protein n=1 Tax=Roseivivax halotolerans TaxID=93684 RepID=A0A1I5ZMM9_9RHOB|nr:YdcH family protein [Roseivivax halotolerans]SFQ57719.1 hypothetical protein SAMN05421853_1113 [Roseivivax halotolerans]